MRLFLVTNRYNLIWKVQENLKMIQSLNIESKSMEISMNKSMSAITIRKFYETPVQEWWPFRNQSICNAQFPSTNLIVQSMWMMWMVGGHTVQYVPYKLYINASYCNELLRSKKFFPIFMH